MAERVTVGVVAVHLSSLVFVADLAGEGLLRDTPETLLQTANLLRLQQNLPLQVLGPRGGVKRARCRVTHGTQ